MILLAELPGKLVRRANAFVWKIYVAIFQDNESTPSILSIAGVHAYSEE